MRTTITVIIILNCAMQKDIIENFVIWVRVRVGVRVRG